MNIDYTHSFSHDKAFTRVETLFSPKITHKIKVGTHTYKFSVISTQLCNYYKVFTHIIIRYSKHSFRKFL